MPSGICHLNKFPFLYFIPMIYQEFTLGHWDEMVTDTPFGLVVGDNCVSVTNEMHL